MKRVDQSVHKRVFKENKNIDDSVSFDGTWAKRGFTSLTGVVFVISIDTYEVLDYHVLSTSYQKCALRQSKCGDDEFEHRKIERKAMNNCDIHFGASSPTMQSEGGNVVWEQSLSTHNRRYR